MLGPWPWGPSTFQRFPAASLSPCRAHRRRAERLQPSAVSLRRSLVQHGPGGKQQQQQQSPVLYSPTSALQKACCGWTGAQLHASVSSSARHRTSSASVQRMPLTVNGIFINTDATVFLQPLRCCVCCADALRCRSSGRQWRHPPPFLAFTDRDPVNNTGRSAPVWRWGFTVCVLGGSWRCLGWCLQLSVFRECFRSQGQGGL